MIAPLLTVLCVTKAEPHALPFLKAMYTAVRSFPFDAVLQIHCDGPEALGNLTDWACDPDDGGLPNPALIPYRPDLSPAGGKGWPGLTKERFVMYQHAIDQQYVESVLEGAVAACHGEYILRLDDDERMNEPMWQWLYAERFREQDHWKFDRAHLWQDEQHYITEPHLWPDQQTRLSTKLKAGGRKTIHAGSPHGGGALAPGCVIEHHVFLVRSREEREAKLARYNQIHPGAGWPIFHTPEVFGEIPVAPYSSARHPYDVD